MVLNLSVLGGNKKKVNHDVGMGILLSKFSSFPPQFLRKWVIPVTGFVHELLCKICGNIINICF